MTGVHDTGGAPAPVLISGPEFPESGRDGIVFREAARTAAPPYPLIRGPAAFGPSAIPGAMTRPSTRNDATPPAGSFRCTGTA
ncbi:hypothetical protein BH11ACT3_BH11ACT3_18100 [soil metagenome]